MRISACSPGEDRLTSYRFGTGAANHLFCAVCGVKSFYQPRSHPDAWSVNLNALDDASGLAITVTAFDGRNWERPRPRSIRRRRGGAEWRSAG